MHRRRSLGAISRSVRKQQAALHAPGGRAANAQERDDALCAQSASSGTPVVL